MALKGNRKSLPDFSYQSSNWPSFAYERKLHKKGYKIIAGVDEVGRGCFAGPVVAGCVVFPAGLVVNGGVLSRNSPKSTHEGTPALGLPVARHPSILINDSKKLSPKRREIADRWIRKNALAFGIGQASVAQINRLGIKKASEIAFRKAIKDTGIEINYLLIDAFYIPYIKGLRRKNQKPIIKGDTKSISIAAASIVAKVYRDKLMTDLGKKSKYRKYKWTKNKGYGTLDHREAIKKHGTTRQHRKQFVETWISSSSSSRAQ